MACDRELDEEACYRRFGIHPAPDDVPEVRRVLREQIDRAIESQGDAADTLLMRLLCAQLFHVGDVNDALLVWAAKRSCFDAGCSIDVQLLCGAGLGPTRSFLAAHASTEATAALEYLDECIGTGDFEAFAVDEWRGHYATYYAAFDEEP